MNLAIHLKKFVTFFEYLFIVFLVPASPNNNIYCSKWWIPFRFCKPVHLVPVAHWNIPIVQWYWLHLDITIASLICVSPCLHYIYFVVVAAYYLVDSDYLSVSLNSIHSRILFLSFFFSQSGYLWFKSVIEIVKLLSFGA